MYHRKTRFDRQRICISNQYSLYLLEKGLRRIYLYIHIDEYLIFCLILDSQFHWFRFSRIHIFQDILHSCRQNLLNHVYRSIHWNRNMWSHRFYLLNFLGMIYKFQRQFDRFNRGIHKENTRYYRHSKNPHIDIRYYCFCGLERHTLLK